MFEIKSDSTDRFAILMQAFRFFVSSLSISLPYAVIIASINALSVWIAYAVLWFTPLGALLFAISSILSFVLSCTLLLRLYGSANKLPGNFVGTFQQVVRKLPNLILLMITYNLIVLGGVMLLVVPGIILIFSLMFCFVLMLADNKNLSQALIDSHRLVWGHWWHCFLTIAFPLLLSLVVLLGNFLFVINIATALHLSIPTTIWILALLNIALQSLLIPFTISVLLMLLHDLKQRKKLFTSRWN